MLGVNLEEMFRSTIDFLIFDFESACDLRTKTLSLVSTCHIYMVWVFFVSCWKLYFYCLDEVTFQWTDNRYINDGN